MTARKTIDELLIGREVRRGKQEDRFLDKLDRQFAAAEAKIGQLVRNGAAIFYINVLTKSGGFTGKTREFATEFAAADFLIRNRYV